MGRGWRRRKVRDSQGRGYLSCFGKQVINRAEQAGMHPDIEPRRSGLGGAIFAIIVIALLCYLTFAALQGEHGLFSLFRVEAQESRLRTELTDLRSAREEISKKTRRLSSEHLDLDLLDERARKVLGLGRPDE